MRKKLLCIIPVFVLFMVYTTCVSAGIVYVDATDASDPNVAANTALATGEIFTADDPGTVGSGADGLWRKRAFSNGGTIFEAGGDWSGNNIEDCPRLMTTVDVPEGKYVVYAYMITAGDAQWRMGASLEDSEGELPVYRCNDPNGAATLAVAEDFEEPVPILTEADRTLWQIYLGTTDTTTAITVYIDDEAGREDDAGAGNSRTWYDGIGYEPAPPGIVYVDATEGEAGNTMLATGEIFEPVDVGTSGSGADGLWRWRAYANEGTIFEAGGSWEGNGNTEDCPRLMTSVEVEEGSYDVYVYMWADGDMWRIQASLEDIEGDLPLYLCNDPNGEATVAVAEDFEEPVPMLTEDNRTLWQVHLGTTDLTTMITVYVDDDPNHLYGAARTWYDGIGYKAASAPEGPSLEGLVAHYALEGDATDSSGNGLDGAEEIIGDGNAAVYVAGVVGMAIDLSPGSNGTIEGSIGPYVNCGYSPLFDFTDGMTVGAWVNIRSLPEVWRAIVTKGDSAWRLATNNTSSGFQFAFGGAGRGYPGANTATQVEFDEWHYVCGTYDKSVGGCIYLDGLLDGTSADLDGIDVNTNDVWIGGNNGDTGWRPYRLFDGMIDEVMIFDRALSADEVAALAGM